MQYTVTVFLNKNMYMPKFFHTRLLSLIFIVDQIFMYSVEGTGSYENKDLFKVKLEPTRHQLTDFFGLLQKFGHETASIAMNLTLHGPVTKSPGYKKWQVGRVSRKQYEIINMLWRKTKELKDVDICTAKLYPSDPVFRIPSRTKSTSTTSSFIEFYYLDEYNNQKHKLLKDEKSQQHKILDNMKRETANYPSFAFHINKPNHVRLTVSTKQTPMNDIGLKYVKTPSPLINNLHNYVTLQKPGQGFVYKNTLDNKIRSFVDDENWPTTETIKIFHRDMINKNSNTMKPKATSTRWNFTTIYDRIKFFELYDKYTPLSYYDERGKQDSGDKDRSVHGNKFRDDFKIILESGSQNQENYVKHKAKHAKKHIIGSNMSNNLNTDNDKLNLSSIFNPTNRKTNTSQSETEVVSSSTRSTKFNANKISRVAEWSDYSFMAAYIYEPSQVNCDAAGISPHWLVISASCLSKRHNNPRAGGRSAFVSYCGSSWWSPDRVAYVKYSVVHPRYNEKDKRRKYMYNIGLIEVVISMATCPGWAPVPLMSHQFVGHSDGSKAYAVGWGLDRYDTRFSARDLPKYPLMAYESRVFSQSCPGSHMHPDSKYKNGDDTIKNLYCLLLPPYSGEETDPIHGSMLLIEGKLCAIYLQEERRPSGNQSAQYIGIWRLGPWVAKMAGEPDVTETFSL